MGSLWRHYCISSHKHTTTHTRVSYRVGGGGGGHYCARVPVVCLTFAPDIFPLTFSPSKDLYKTLRTHAVIHTHTYTHSHTYADSRQNLQTKGSWKSEEQEAQEQEMQLMMHLDQNSQTSTVHWRTIKSTKVQDSMLCVAFLHSIAISHGRPLMLVKLFDLIVKVRQLYPRF